MSELPQGVALVLGINAYSGGISPLKSAVADAGAIAQALREQHGYEVTLLLDEQASAQAITVVFESLAERLKDAEQPFFLYFAGHGVARGDGDDGPQGYLLPQDARPGDADSWVSMTTVRAALEALPSRHLLVVLDCCFAGAFRWAATRDVAWDAGPLYASQYERFLKGTAWQALTSASHEEKALDVAPGRDNTRDDVQMGQHSPFAAALLQGLAGDADTSRPNVAADGVITATELFQYAYDTLVPAGEQSHQTPGIWPLRNDNTGQFIFRNPAVPLNTREDPPLTDDANPWLGLRTYTRDDKALFFGRGRVIDELYERVSTADHSFLAVVGASGTGKSSVVRAGLIPLLADDAVGAEAWQVVAMPRLDANPLKQLNTAVENFDDASTQGPTVLLIDQFEELYTQCADEALRLDFLTRLRALIDQPGAPFVIITLRTDFEPRPRAAQPLHDIWEDARYVVPAFTMQEMREVISGPAHAMALFFEPDELIETLLQEVMAMPGALPLLSFALAEMYRCAQQRRQTDGDNDRALTRADYDNAGGVVGALHRRANLVYGEAQNDEERAAIRILFLRLVSTEAGLTRRRVHRSELVFPEDKRPDIERMIQTFTAARLLVSDGDYIEPAHDTLVVAWDKLQDWLAATHSQELIRATWRAASDWQERREHEDGKLYLWHDDPRLPQLGQQRGQLNQIEHDFVVASRELKERNRRRRRLIVSTVVVALVAAAIISFFQARRAEKQTVIAQEQTAIAKEQYEQARHANGRTRMEQARQSLTDRRYLDAALTSARVIGFKGLGGTGAEEALFDVFDDEYADLIGILSQANATPFRPVVRRPLSYARLASARPLLVGIAQDGRAELWDLASATLAHLELPPLSEYASDGDLALAPDGSRLAIRDNDAIWLWHLDDPKSKDRPQRLTVPLKTDLFGLQFNADATRLAIGSTEGVVVWSFDALTGLPEGAPSVLRTSSFAPSVLTFRPRGQGLLIGGEKHAVNDPNGPLLLIRFADECAAAGLQLKENTPCAVFGGPRSDMLIVEQEGRYRGRLDFARALEFDRGETSVVIGSLNRVFVGEAGDTFQSYDDVNLLLTTAGLVSALALSPDGRALAVASANLIEIVDVRSGRLLARVQPDITDYGTTLSMTFSADGNLLLYAGFAHMTLFDTSFLSRPVTSPGNMPDGTMIEITQDDVDAGETALREYWTRKTTNFDNLRASRLFDRAGFEGEFTADVVREDEQLWLHFGDDQKTAVAAQAAPGSLLAIGINSRGYVGESAIVNVYDRTSSELVLSFSTTHDTITNVGFDSASNTLFAFANFEDGYESTLYRWSLARPDLATLDASDSVCMPPVNVPADSMLEGKDLFDCKEWFDAR